jgi:TonB-linked SusC/RagA family outer membrane protein
MKKTMLFIVLAALCLNFKAWAQNNTHPHNKKISGKITNEQGEPLPGASVKIQNESAVSITDENGKFTFNTVDPKGLITVSFIGFQTINILIPPNLTDEIVIQLKPDANSLNEVQVIGYGITTKRLSTGSLSTISSKDIEDQPVTNVLSALSGKAPGVFVQSTNGLPGGNITIQIRGKGSISAGTAPLYIIDGVPFATNIGGSYTGAGGVLGLSSVNGDVSPFNSINPDDIASISILKDADATAIYGSRGSNGVILITTKKGKNGPAKVDFNFTQGINQAANLPKLLNLQQYLTIRREAFANDGLTPSSDPNSSNYAPDLTVWSQSKGTDWVKELLGGKGHNTDAQFTVSGGSNGNSFNAGGNFHSESTYLKGDNLYQRGGVHLNFQHTSADSKFYFQFVNSLVLDNNNLSNSPSLGTDIFLPPNYPLYDATGNYNWFYANPVAETKAVSLASTTNVINNIILSYSILPGLTVKTSAGYNTIILKQTQEFPSVSLYPGTPDYTNFGNNSNHTFIVEPQINYAKGFGKSNIAALLGATYQNSVSEGDQIIASSFSSESLMRNFAAAQTYNLSNSYTQYKYESLFGRITYNYDNKYILNGTVRRDGSSRFGSGNQFGNFGSIGGAWLFGSEPFIKQFVPQISFGKLRASYGLTGNDQITDYQYLSTYRTSGYQYEGVSGLQPGKIANADFHWETTKKLEFGIDLGLFSDRILLTVDYYRNRSSDQLVNYKIPYLTGFNSYQANLPADVQNKGWEFEFTSKNIRSQNFSWTTTFNLTLPKNTLLSFKNLATSSYANTLLIGYDITRIYNIHFIGVDAATGLASYATVPGSSSTDPDYYTTIGKQTPDFYGGIGNTFTYHRWELEIFGQFARQMVMGGLPYTPGLPTNNYQTILGRWQKSGDETTIPKSSTNEDYNYTTSSANYFESPYFRIKNVALSYALPVKWVSAIKASNCRIYFQGQNLLTFSNKNLPLLDPESGASPNLPPVRTFTVGFQLSL